MKNKVTTIDMKSLDAAHAEGQVARKQRSVAMANAAKRVAKSDPATTQRAGSKFGENFDGQFVKIHFW